MGVTVFSLASTGFFLRATLSVAVHFSVRQKGARDSRGRPGLAVGPAAHAGLALVPDVDAARLDLKTFTLRKPTSNTRNDTQTACFKKKNGIKLGADVAMEGFHSRDVHFFDI